MNLLYKCSGGGGGGGEGGGAVGGGGGGGESKFHQIVKLILQCIPL